ncbi:MAG: hypothetical protein R3B71_02080 [Candidatus Gracilibacteria bacterium]
MGTFLNILGSIGVALLLYVAFLMLVRFIRNAADKDRMLNMVFLRIMVPKKESKEDQQDEQGSRGGDFKEVIGVASQLLSLCIVFIVESGKPILPGRISFRLSTPQLKIRSLFILWHRVIGSHGLKSR